MFVDKQCETACLDAYRYLKSVCGRFSEGAETKLAVELGAPMQTILAYAHNHHIDLIVMSTHGRTVFLHVAYGSVADAILRASRVPVLLVGAPEASEQPP